MAPPKIGGSPRPMPTLAKASPTTQRSHNPEKPAVSSQGIAKGLGASAPPKQSLVEKFTGPGHKIHDPDNPGVSAQGTDKGLGNGASLNRRNSLPAALEGLTGPGHKIHNPEKPGVSAQGTDKGLGVSAPPKQLATDKFSGLGNKLSGAGERLSVLSEVGSSLAGLASSRPGLGDLQQKFGSMGDFTKTYSQLGDQPQLNVNGQGSSQPGAATSNEASPVAGRPSQALEALKSQFGNSPLAGFLNSPAATKADALATKAMGMGQSLYAGATMGRGVTQTLQTLMGFGGANRSTEVA